MQTAPASDGPSPGHHLTFLLVCLLLWLQPALLFSAPEPATLTSARAFYNQTPDEQMVDRSIDFSFTVLFYDPHWKVLWGTEPEGPFFLKTAGAPLPIRSGHQVRLKGLVSLKGGLQATPDSVTITGEAPPTPPVPATFELSNPRALDQKMVTVVGVVDELRKPDANHASFGLIVEGHPVNVHVLTSSKLDLLYSKVQVTGLLALERIGALPEQINIWVHHRSELIRKGSLVDDPGFNRPLTPANRIHEQKASELVHVRGITNLQKPGAELWLTDETGEILIESAQRLQLAPGTLVDAIGYPSSRGERPCLVNAWFVASDKLPIREGDNAKTITQFKDWFSMPLTERQKDWPIDTVFRIRYYDPYWKMLWVEDGSGSYYVQSGQSSFSFSQGELVHVRGMYSESRGLRVQSGGIDILEGSRPMDTEECTETVSDHARYDSRLVTMVGYVDRQTYVDAQHENLRMLVNGELVNVHALHEAGTPYKKVQGAIVRISGLYSSNAEVRADEPKINLLCAEPNHLQFLHWLRADPGFQKPVSPIESLRTLPRKERVRVSGVVHRVNKAEGIDIRDNTGQLRLLTFQDEQVKEGEQIEALGYPEVQGLQLRLANALFIRSAKTLAESENDTTGQSLRLIGQVVELNASQAVNRYPVRVTAQCIWSTPSLDYFYAQDSSGGIRFVIQDKQLDRPAPGDTLLIGGETQASANEPYVLVHSLRLLHQAQTPPAMQLTLEQARTGIGNAEIVGIQALLRGVKQEGNFYHLDFLCSSGAFRGMLPARDDPTALVGSIVNARGVNLVTKSRLRTPEVQLLHGSLSDISLIEKRPADLNQVPKITLSLLALNPPKPGTENLVRVRGQVTLHAPGSHLFIEEGSEAMCLFTDSKAPLPPGEWIEAVGLPVWHGSHLVLQESIVRSTGEKGEVKPIPLAYPHVPDANLDGFLVGTEGVLMDDPEALQNVGSLNFQQGARLFLCSLAGPNHGPAVGLAKGAKVAITGIYHVVYGENNEASGFNIELRSPDDLTVLSNPSWWTAERALAMAGALAGLLGLTAGWILLLRRKVLQQTEIIRAQMEKQTQLMAEIERSARLESLGLLAGGIAHDFNNMLTVVAGNITLARMEDGVEQTVGNLLHEAEQGALRARSLTQQLLTFARGGSPMRRAEDLREFLQEEITKAHGQSKTKLRFDIQPDLWRGYVDKAQLTQVLQNLSANALQAMTEDGELTVTASNQEIETSGTTQVKPGRYLRICVTDTGEGIPEANLGKIFDPYFTTRQSHRGIGLSLVRSIVKKHEGQITVSSRPGVGTTFTVWLPAANEAAGDPRESTLQVTRTRPLQDDLERPRILFMDDEAPIRLIAGALFRKLGYEVVLVSDGEQAVKEYKARFDRGQPFHLLIFDLAVPGGMGGKEALEKIHALDPKAFAMVSSGYSNDPVMASPQSYGFASVLAKPYQMEDLAKAVDALLGRKHKPTITHHPGA